MAKMKFMDFTRAIHKWFIRTHFIISERRCHNDEVVGTQKEIISAHPPLN